MLETKKSKPSIMLVPSPKGLINDNTLEPKAAGKLNINIDIDTTIVVFLRFHLVSDIVKAIIFSNTAIIVVKAAIDKNKKNNAPHNLPKTIELNILGKVRNTKPAP